MSFQPQSPYGPYPTLKVQALRVGWPGNIPQNPVSVPVKTPALEHGRMLEKSLGEALDNLREYKQYLFELIQSYIANTIDNCVAKAPDSSRPTALTLRNLEVVKKINKTLTDVQKTQQALLQLAGELRRMAGEHRAFLQQNLQAMSSLMREICNWNIPPLPPIPTMFGGLIDFSGIILGTFPANTFNFSPSFDFSFNQCRVRAQNLNIFRQASSGFVVNLPDGPHYYLPPSSPLPWGGRSVDPNTLSLNERADIQATQDTPIFDATYQPSATSPLPDPKFILSDYHLTPTQYRTNIGNILFATTTTLEQITNYRSLLASTLPLRNQDWGDTNLNVLAGWLYWLEANRDKRGGVWLEANQQFYDTYITPSLVFLHTESLPYNTKLGTEVTKVGPTTLPLVSAYNNLTPEAQGVFRWRLSYLEAGLLGVERDTTWDSHATGEDYRSDYLPATRSGQTLQHQITTPSAQILLNFDAAWSGVFQRVIQRAAQDLSHNPTWVGAQKFRFRFDIFANLQETDQATQFWRTVEERWLSLQAKAELNYIMGAFSLANGAINPLGDAVDYDRFCDDWANKDHTWSPGQELIPQPTGKAQQDTTPEGFASTIGWDHAGGDLDNLNTIPSFDPTSFLGRPDVQARPEAEQYAMLTLNQIYATSMHAGAIQLQGLNQAVQDAEASAQDLSGLVTALSSALTTLQAGGATTEELQALQGGMAVIGITTPPLTGGTPTTGGSPTTTQTTTGASALTFPIKNPSTRPGAVCRMDAEGFLVLVLPTQVAEHPPYFDGVTTKVVGADSRVEVVTIPGSLVPFSASQGWRVGDMLYVGRDGYLTNDVTSLTLDVWVIPMGRVVSGDHYLYEPQVPFNYNVVFQPE